eukprot:Seg2642.2 transcript_id=Seg2642.2/GoldUCD/mRNA.D3Y31 product="Protein POLR1D isoform 2" protein_id=Seg2642.2/GoldUCD/D3Y31
MADNNNGRSEDAELDRLAREELLRDVQRAKTRTETLGAIGWRPCPLPKTNKRFLRNMLVGSIQTNHSTKGLKAEKNDADDAKPCKIRRKTSHTQERNKDSHCHKRASKSRKFEKIPHDSRGKISSGRTRKYKNSSHSEE